MQTQPLGPGGPTPRTTKCSSLPSTGQIVKGQVGIACDKAHTRECSRKLGTSTPMISIRQHWSRIQQASQAAYPKDDLSTQKSAEVNPTLIFLNFFFSISFFSVLLFFCHLSYLYFPFLILFSPHFLFFFPIFVILFFILCYFFIYIYIY